MWNRSCHKSKPCWREWTWSNSRWERSPRSEDSQSGRRAWWSTAWCTAVMGRRRMSAAASCLPQRWTEPCCWMREKGEHCHWHTRNSGQSRRQYQIPKPCMCFSLTENILILTLQANTNILKWWTPENNLQRATHAGMADPMNLFYGHMSPRENQQYNKWKWSHLQTEIGHTRYPALYGSGPQLELLWLGSWAPRLGRWNISPHTEATHTAFQTTSTGQHLKTNRKHHLIIPSYLWRFCNCDRKSF